jgi:hypothetical protein
MTVLSILISENNCIFDRVSLTGMDVEEVVITTFKYCHGICMWELSNT